MSGGYDPYTPRNPAGEKSVGETTVQITLPDGTTTQPATIDDLRKAVDTIKRDSGERRAERASGNTVAGDQLRAIVERVERLEEEKKTIAEDIKEVYGEAKAMGFDPKVLRRVIAIRKQDEAQRMEFEAILDTYLHALGMV